MREIELTTLSCHGTSHSLRLYCQVRKEYKSNYPLSGSLEVKVGFK
jgi:hypothetical protein